ncbi:MAG TPA: hypothetical protein VG937_14325 [Polyangiaceae bacterium]|jgi:hypothetical protein|nr:hypothetical protein [Polyangiaceae bacterium]
MARAQFFRGIVFALLAGAGSVLALLLVAPRWGYAGAAALWGLGAALLYPLFVSANLRRGILGSVLGAALSLPVAALVTDPSVVLTLALVVLALCRSVCVFPRPFARALLFELFFLGLGLALACFFQDGSLVGVAFATWAFWLVQAGFALTVTSSVKGEELGDPFERAHAAAQAVLERRL